MSESADPSGALRSVDARPFADAPLYVQATLRAYDAVFNKHDLESALPEVDEARACTTRQDVRSRLADLLRAFPDSTARDLLVFDLGHRRVAVKFTFSGTNSGPLGPGTPPTGRHVEAEITDVVQFDRRGRVVDAKHLSELDVIRRQLGVD